MLTDYFLPHTTGGVERAVFELSRRLASRGHRVTVLTFGAPCPTQAEPADRIEIVRVLGFDLTHFAGIQLSVSPVAWVKISSILSSRTIDVVHAHNLFFNLSLNGALLAKAFRIPLVTTVHLDGAGGLGGAYGALATLYERSVGSLILRLSSKVIAVSDAVARHARGLGASPASLITIPNGVDMRRFSSARRGGGAVPKVVFVGRLIFNKGPQFLLAAVPKVLERHPAAQFEIVGDGPMCQELEAEAERQGLGKSVRFFGQRDDVERFLAVADVFVRPSLTEGMPLAVLEAMSSGLPVVATRVGGTPEIVKDGVTGYLVDPGNPAQLAECLCVLLADPELRSRMGRQGRTFVENGYGWDDVSDRTLGVYRQALVAVSGRHE